MVIYEKRILGIDFGRRRMGIAISDPMRIVAQGLETITYHSSKDLWDKLEAVLTRYEIEKIVVGIPLNLNGSESDISLLVKKFSELLTKRFKIPVEFWDERFTSKTAQETLIQMGKSPGRNKKKVDQIAAVLILQNYLDRHSNL
ncbi:putative Holliday junction resolvase [bacterium BMS3Abin05]|nr:putative Holliday junction resolvase [bacterium BMS3Abin05]GBE27330.1 putative Holliday junction resolvase [bacterium BMS3Bbin03]HDK36549.1 Holliday junction resolvase RuvX [Bacteroidota bacterium]HDL77998.1 Holliday junction resolvase RuvX [Bacteroidota bacterium]HDZ10666.1 Holliday junction resolvase RuvX [Bacteroidota bacterium]